MYMYRCLQLYLVPIPYDSKCVTVFVTIAVSVHASVSASVSVSALVTVYCYFHHPGALPPPSAQLLQLPFSSITKGTGSLSNPLSPGAENCNPEGTAHPSIAVVVLTLACVEVGFTPIRSHPCEGYKLRSTAVCVPPHSMGSGAGSASGLKSRLVSSGSSISFEFVIHNKFLTSSRYRCACGRK